PLAGNTAGAAGDITISVPTLQLTNNSRIGAASRTNGGPTGDITIDVNELDIRNSLISTSSENDVQTAGNIIIQANDSIFIDGGIENTIEVGGGGGGDRSGGILAEATLGGDAGTVTLSAPQLTVNNNGAILTSTISGVGGNLQLQDINNLSINNGRISASTQTGTAGSIQINSGEPAATRIALQGNNGEISARADREGGSAGGVQLNSRTLQLSDGASISTTNISSSTGGSVQLTAIDVLELSNGSGITASTQTGRAGSVQMNTGQNAASRVNVQGGSEIAARADAASGQAGDVQLNSREVTVRDNANISTSNISSPTGGSVQLTGIELLDLNNRGAIATSTQTGQAGSIQVNVGQNVANRISVQGGSEIAARAESRGGQAGDVQLNSQMIELDNAAISTTNVSGAAGSNIQLANVDTLTLRNGQITASTQDGQGGSITIDTATTTLSSASNIDASTSGRGNAGAIAVTARDALTIQDNSTLSTTTTGAGNAGNLDISTTQLTLQNNGQITASTTAAGRAGSITIRDAEQVSLVNQSTISTALEPGATVDPSAQPGNISIQTQALSLENNSEITASTAGIGSAGIIEVLDADTIALNNSRISTAINQGATAPQSSSITLNTRSLALANNSDITASTAGQGNAGTITIPNAEQITLSNSTIATTVGPTGIGQGGNIDIETNTLELGNRAQITSSTAGQGNAGQVGITTATATLGNQSQITTSTSGQGNAGQIGINATDAIALRQGSQITTAVRSGAIGNADRVILQTPDLSLRSNSAISAATNGTGNAGSIRVLDANQISLDNSRISTSLGRNAIAQEAGNINLQTNRLLLNNNASITATTAGDGDGGQIRIREANAVSLDDSQISTAIRQGATATTPGSIRINTDALQLTNGANIIASTAGEGSAGQIQIQAGDRVILDSSTIATEVESTATATQPGSIEIDTGLLRLTNAASITASTDGIGDAGEIVLNVNDLEMSDRAQITSQSTTLPNVFTNNSGQNLGQNRQRHSRNGLARVNDSTRANAGDITITIANDLQMSDSDISTQSAAFAGGEITISARDIRLNGDSDIRTNVASGSDNGGNITLTADSIIAFDDSDIVSSAAGGSGGNITLDTPIFFGEALQINAPGETDFNDRVDINATGQVSGTIITPDVSFIQNSLNNLPEGVINTETLIANSCVVRSEDGGSTFLITGSGGLRDRPNVPHLSNYATGEVQTIPDDAPVDELSWQRGDSIIEAEAVYQLPNGEWIVSHDCPSGS
ncbi:MAG: S-layer family protein, partial [Merismopedia sp. SIO2A8]|nr:S-layer family protein [Merismopedia sp. SIO2A8]